jgi:hypothetical protein
MIDKKIKFFAGTIGVLLLIGSVFFINNPELGQGLMKIDGKTQNIQLSQKIFKWSIKTLPPRRIEPIKFYTIYETTNEAEDFGFIDNNLEYYKEKETIIMSVERENVKTLVPKGYEKLAKAHIEDLIRCRSLLSIFFGGISFPKEKIKIKIYISTDDSNLSFSNFNKIIYKKSQENIDFDLQDVITNNPDGFLYNSNMNYCTNTHELTHAFFGGTPVPSFADEGLAQFTQKHNQGDLFDYLSCEDTGYYSYDEWNEYSDMSLDQMLDYDTAMCFIEEIFNSYGEDNFHSMLARLNEFQTGELDWNLLATHHFVKDVLEYTYGSEILEILRKYGIEEEDYEIN